MLAELLEYALTPCPHYVRRMGYLYEAIAIRARAARCRTAWAPHQQQTRSFILRAAKLCSQRRTAVVLGSGLLLDVPLAELAQQFHEVVLVDVVHPLGTSWGSRRFGNVRRLAADVTGVAQQTLSVARDPHATLPSVAPTLLLDDNAVDFVASVNLLSQLPYLPATYLTRAGKHPADAIAVFARDIVLAHLAYLRRFRGVATLVTDCDESRVDPHGTVLSTVDTLYGVAPPSADATWEWQLAPRPEADRRFSLQRRVIGVLDLKRLP